MNRNDWLKELLTWHGHERAGVKVPFATAMGNPLHRQIETNILKKLSAAAKDLATGEADTPRWLFLVGGPGNGKSEAVEYFIKSLDTELSVGGELVGAAAASFQQQGMLSRVVEINQTKLVSHAAHFADKIGKLVIIQDASASDEPNGRASEILLREIEELLTSPSEQKSVFLCCCNRGVLSSALQDVGTRDGYGAIVKVIRNIISATALARVSGKNRPTCWPLLDDHRFACWPMDFETLLESTAGPSAFSTILSIATDSTHWDSVGVCTDCSSKSLCPFYQNKVLLSNPAGSKALEAGLRRGELATGRRWNFRELFSLVAELLVGVRGDFRSHPCDWTHDEVKKAGPNPVGVADESVALLALNSRLYTNALHPRISREFLAEEASVARSHGNITSESILSFLALPSSGTHHVREVLKGLYSAKLDPALDTPEDDPLQLSAVEDFFNHSVKSGLDKSKDRLMLLEARLLHCLHTAEAEWDTMEKASAVSLKMRRLFREQACSIAKRGIASRAGRPSGAHWIDEYKLTLRDVSRLRQLAQDLGKLFGERDRFDASLIESFGQPLKNSGVRTVSPKPNIRPILAPSPNNEKASHDMPFLDVSQAYTALPLTFDLFLAIKLRNKQCANSCLPASTRSAIDRARQLLAGINCRNIEGINDGTVKITVFSSGELVLNAVDEPHYLTNSHGN